MLPDTDIMVRVQAGEEQLFALLVERHQLAMLRFAASKLMDRGSAEDQVQEAFLAAFRARASYSPDFAVSTWLWTILLNLCRNANRAAARRASVLAEAHSQEMLQPRHVAQEAWLHADDHAQLRALLERLPEEEADALRLRFFGGLKFEEIALAMDSSVSGAKVRVKRGLQRLRELL